MDALGTLIWIIIIYGIAAFIFIGIPLLYLLVISAGIMYAVEFWKKRKNKKDHNSSDKPLE